MNRIIENLFKSKKMKPIGKISVATFIIIAFVAGTVLLLTGFGILDYKLDKDRQWKNLQKELARTAEELRLNLTLPAWNLDYPQIDKIIESSMSNQNIYGIIFNAQNKILMRTRGADWQIITPEKEFSPDGLLLEKRDIIFSNETIGTIRLFGSTKLMKENLKITFISIMSFVSIFVLIIIVGLYLVLRAIVLNPVMNIEQYSVFVSSGKGKGLRIKGNYFQGELDLLRSSIEKMVNAHEDRFNALQNEIKLRTESEERFHTIFDSSNDALLICDKNTGDIIHVNEKMREIFGYTYNEEMQTNISFISPDNLHYIPGEFIERLMNNSGKPYSGEWDTKNKKGDVFCVEISIKDTIIDNQNRALISIRDITKRKQAEEDRRLSEEKYRNIVEKSIEGIFQTTNNGEFLNVNPAMARLYGYDSPEDMIIGVTDIQNEIYVNPGERERFKNDIENNGKVEGFESQFYRKDKKKIWISINARTVLDSDGMLLYYEGTAMDITVRKNAEDEKERLESQLRQAQKIEAIGTLAGGIAHDFNNIISVILGFGSLLQEHFGKNDPIRNYVDHIVLAAEKAANLIKSLLSFSRKKAVQLQPVKLNDIIEGVEKLLITSLTEDISLQKNLSDKDPAIMGDITQIEQILFNLATNARDAMPGGGKLIIETKLMDVSDDFTDILGYGEPGTYVLLSISDTGKGIDKEIKEHIFDPFYTTKEVGKGTGLGLSTVYGIVKQHNGYITVYSEPGMGTAFHIYFPVISADVEDRKIESQIINGGNETILIAEDNDSVRYFMKTVLAKYGYNVIEAIDGEDAVQKYRPNSRIDLMILDSVMPKKNGREVYDELKKDKPDIKVLFTSGYTKDIILDKGIEEKEVEFISKPLTLNALLKKVREVLSKQ
jgi:PAS domain S-box-containing protein